MTVPVYHHLLPQLDPQANESGRGVLLLVDIAPVYIQVAETLQQVRVVKLPPNTTALSSRRSRCDVLSQKRGHGAKRTCSNVSASREQYGAVQCVLGR